MQKSLSLFFAAAGIVTVLTTVTALRTVASVSAREPMACTMEAKLCPDGKTYVGRDSNRNCAFAPCPSELDSCAPYLCRDGTQVNRCSEDGTVINYFAAPCLTHGGEVGDGTESFSDVSPSHVHADAIAYVKAEGIAQGYDDGTYRPNQKINRAEFTKIVIGSNFTDRALGFCVDYGFSDTSRTVWYSPFICLAAQHRIIEGYPDGTFRPALSISFVEAAKIIVTIDNFYINGVYYNDVMANGERVGLPLPEGSDGFWYEPYVRYLSQKNAIPVSVTRFDQSITRGEMAEMIWRLKTKNTTEASLTYEDLR